ncbi:hypothetical protein E2562_024308 [Oryza meyeriana var. granulata]|uniref:Uncharacterized protein n=1 Tax=Oryza meyeriana var. granulata TaxID=110450 RepID=A0A6G1C8C7_9ORYZ|nr:hypothetical protein E2562_024308 [Oryza meyeriana var. granulata]
MAATRRMAYSIAVVFMLLLIMSSTFSSCYAAGETRDRETLQRHRECKQRCGGHLSYCPPENPCCCVSVNAPASSPSGAKTQSGDVLVIN